MVLPRFSPALTWIKEPEQPSQVRGVVSRRVGLYAGFCRSVAVDQGRPFSVAPKMV